ncbi:MAG: flagellar export chaperone FliS [Magnetococcales bacterium]|nr:flagellar export chaperone FliS [Magnetococcales bacterium]
MQAAMEKRPHQWDEADEILNMTPLGMLIRLYEGAIDFLSQSEQALKEQRIDAFKERLERGARIIREFQRTLNFKTGGQVSAQLNDLYTFMLDSLKQAELTHEPLYIQRVTRQLNTLLDGWRGAQPLVEA